MGKSKNITVSELKKMIEINVPIVYINDFDTIRINQIIFDSIKDYVPIENVKEWNPGVGYVNFPNLRTSNRIDGDGVQNITQFLSEIANVRKTPLSFLLLREIQDYITLPQVKSLLALIAQRKLYDPDFNLIIIIISSVINIPVEIEHYVSLLEIRLPTDDEIDELVKMHTNINGYKEFDEKSLEHLRPNFRGMQPFEIDRMIDMAMSNNGTLTEADTQLILQHKKQLIKKSGLVELIDTEKEKKNLKIIGGLKGLKEYLQERAIIRNKIHLALKSRVKVPKGIMLIGFPGCGKSLSAQAAADLFKEPLLKLDMGTLMGSYVGESEKNLRKVIKLAEAVAPCVLFIDEIEKGFAGSKNDENAYLRRMMGFFLSWLQDNQSMVYVIATANSIENLPDELIRKGRFDEIFFIDLPNKSETAEIFNKKLADPKLIINENSELVDWAVKHHFCGADIEHVVYESFETIFLGKQTKLDENLLLNIAKTTKSLGEVLGESGNGASKIEQIQKNGQLYRSAR